MIVNRSPLFIGRAKIQAKFSLALDYRKRICSSASSTQAAGPSHQAQERKSNKEAEYSIPSGQSLDRIATDCQVSRSDNIKLWHSVELIKRLGHLMSHLDPLELRQPERFDQIHWAHKLVDEMRSSHEMVSTKGFLSTKQPVMPAGELISAVWDIYTGSQCGLEFGHMSNQEEIEWLTSNWEQLSESFHLSQVEKHNLAKLLTECEAFDHFMATKYPSVKRYGCEGAESMLVVFDEILRLCHLGDTKTELDEMTRSIGAIDDVIIGMPHRGRLNLLTCLLGVDPSVVFHKTRGECELDTREAWMSTGDVLSHLSTNMRFVYGADKHHIGLSRDTPRPINVSLLPNPSHLEVSSPLVAGAARGRAHNIHHRYSSSPKFASLTETSHSRMLADKMATDDYTRFAATILPVQVHGDASIAGQGIVQETLQMSRVPQFSVGGSLHLVVNNQIGYTTEGATGRSSRYCTDVLKLIEAPIIHVNGQNIDNVVRATRLALAFRQRFGKDIAIDLICYRQHGHNELDEPSFTQPLMYEAIRSRKTIPQLYCESIGLDTNEREQIAEDFKARMQDANRQLDKYKPDNDSYRNFNLISEYHRDHICTWRTGCELSLLKSVALASVDTPADFCIHPNLKRVLVDERRNKFSVATSKDLEDTKVDWATAEILAFGSLLKQNNTIRIAGQDVARGTFSTRHAILFDQLTGEPFCPLNSMMTEELPGKDGNTINETPKAKLEVANTILSEEAAMAYEFGYSIETCNLTIWEAQFGDFYNTAQSIVDTLVSSSETKWLKQSPLTLLLPHGIDGAGPEHSSSRLERFLQMSSSSMDSVDTEAKVNWSVCYPTLPSQYFHLLRRQVLRPFRKPLILMAPKIIFRHPSCVSNLADFGPEMVFQPVLKDPNCKDAQLVDSLVLCSGKVYFQLEAEKQRLDMQNVAIIRLEELCPFPIQALAEVMRLYPKVKKDGLFWFQEEHKNQGAYSFVDTRLSRLANIRLNYMGRQESEMPATGSSSLHKKELHQIMRQFQSLK